MPPAGSHWSRPATSSISTMATQKVGSDWPSTAITCAARSMPVPFHTAASTPSGKARRRLTVIANAASRSELGSRCAISSPTGRRARSDIPKSPVSARPTNDRYCSTYGRSRPRYFRALAKSSSLADIGRIRWSGSPVARASTNTTTERMARAASDWRRRVRTNRATPAQRFDEASSSRKKSYITVPGFHLPSVFDAAYGECR